MEALSVVMAELVYDIAYSYPSTALLQQTRDGCLLWGLTLSG